MWLVSSSDAELRKNQLSYENDRKESRVVRIQDSLTQSVSTYGGNGSIKILDYDIRTESHLVQSSTHPDEYNELIEISCHRITFDEEGRVDGMGEFYKGVRIGIWKFWPKNENAVVVLKYDSLGMQLDSIYTRR